MKAGLHIDLRIITCTALAVRAQIMETSVQEFFTRIAIHLGSQFALLFCLLAWFAPPVLAAEPAAAWGCYDPQPGHPTQAERVAFVRQVGPAAQTAESHYGVPAPALAAMAINESGYGFTRTALHANNLFGWKDYSESKQSYVLDCQPTKDDPENHYVAFKSFANSIDEVGQHLGLHATNAAYAAASHAYWQERQAGAAVSVAILHWLQAIHIAHYNDNPAYPDETIRYANNYMEPGSTISPTTNLYVLASAQVVAPTPAPPKPAAASTVPADLLASVTKTIAGRYKVGGVYTVGSVNLADMSKTKICTPVPIVELQNPIVKPYADGISPKAGAKLLECIYFPPEDEKSLLWIIDLLDTPSNLAKRILTACATSAGDVIGDCADYFLDGSGDFQMSAASPYMLPEKWDRRSSYNQNSFIFPVTGWISSECNVIHNVPLGAVAFRDGVTVQFPNAPDGSSQYCIKYASHTPISWQKTFALQENLMLIYCYGRLAEVNRNDLPGFGIGCTKAGVKPDGFLTLVRNNEIKAVNTGTDDLMIFKAAQFRQALVRKPPVPKH